MKPSADLHSQAAHASGQVSGRGARVSEPRAAFGVGLTGNAGEALVEPPALQPSRLPDLPWIEA
jgi:hypothetical protein